MVTRLKSKVGAVCLAASVVAQQNSVQAASTPSLLPAPPMESEFEKNIVHKTVPIRAVRISGNKALPDAAFADVIKEYEGRSLNTMQIRELERRLTQVYRDNGFVTSGVLLSPQVLADDVLQVQAVEGTVTELRFAKPPRWSRAGFLTREIIRSADAPLNLTALQDSLALLRESGLVDRINAELVPLSRIGESALLVDVEEGNPLRLAIAYDNHRSPTIGARRSEISVAHMNLTGWGDEAEARVGTTRGLKDASLKYQSPQFFFSTRLGFHWDRSDSVAIDPPIFRSLDIKADSSTNGIDLVHAVMRRPDLAVLGNATVERRESTTTLLGFPFSFIPAIPDGVSRIEAARLGFNVTSKSERHVQFFKLQVSRGKTNALEADSSVPTPARRFSLATFQYQFAQRFDTGKIQLIGRLQGQATRDYLLPLERISLTGSEAVRGFRESLVLRDRGIIGTIEVQAPIAAFGEWISLYGAVFADAAWGNNVNRASDGLPTKIASAGLGLILKGNAGISGALYLARPNQRWLTPRLDGQDRGIHFALTVRFL